MSFFPATRLKSIPYMGCVIHKYTCSQGDEYSITIAPSFVLVDSKGHATRSHSVLRLHRALRDLTRPCSTDASMDASTDARVTRYDVELSMEDMHTGSSVRDLVDAQGLHMRVVLGTDACDITMYDRSVVVRVHALEPHARAQQLIRDLTAASECVPRSECCFTSVKECVWLYKFMGIPLMISKHLVNESTRRKAAASTSSAS
jgi:hypothetical protein